MKEENRRNYKWLFTTVLCMILLSILVTQFSLAFSDSEKIYDTETDYMAEMRICAEVGTEEQLRHGRLCELCRNLKIRDLGLDYEETNFFDGRSGEEILADIEAYTARYTMVYVGRFYITGYDICVECCGKTDGITYSGTQATVGRTCGASFSWPIGTEFYIEGLGHRTVEDRGYIKSDYHLDVLCSNHDECYTITGWYDVWKVGA